jgi:hypothetical protein
MDEIMHGYSLDGLMAILGKVVVANNRLVEDIRDRDQKLNELSREVGNMKAELEKLKNVGLESTRT